MRWDKMGDSGYQEECQDDDISILDDDWSTIDDDETVCDSDDGLTLVEEVMYKQEQKAMSAFQEAIKKIYRGNAWQKYLKPIAYQE